MPYGAYSLLSWMQMVHCHKRDMYSTTSKRNLMRYSGTDLNLIIALIYLNLFSRGSHCLKHSNLRFDPWQGGNYYFLPGTGITRDGRVEPQSPISVPNIPELNPKFLHSAYVKKAYVLLTVIRPSDGDVRSGRSLGAFQ